MRLCKLLKSAKTVLLYKNTCCRRFCSTFGYELDLQINGVCVNNYVKALQKEYEALANGPTAKQRALELQPVIKALNERTEVISDIASLAELLEDTDQEMRKLAREEKADFEQKIKLIDEELLHAILPAEEESDNSSIMLEVNTGVGGQEAMLFAGELFEMYCNFASYKGWEVEIAEYSVTDIGGIRHGSALISGNSVFQYFKHEAGVHRVQRIPATEKSGRIHTSTVSVLALPQPSEIEVNIEAKDLKIETKRASGAGGQHVNTTDSAVRMVHLPTGISVECQVDRSQMKNRKIALMKLRTLLYQQQLDSHIAKSEATKKSQVRSNFRNEKIRTYNFSQDRITDHRLQGANIHNLRGFLQGGQSLEELIDKLEEQRKIDTLLKIVSDFNSKQNK